MDNAAAVHYVNFRYGDVDHLEKLASELEYEERISQCWALAIHIKGSANIISDAGSRDTGFATAWGNDVTRQASLIDSVMRPITEKFGPFALDMFSRRQISSRSILSVAADCFELCYDLLGLVDNI